MTITSPHNEQLKAIRKLAGRKWRDKLREFVAEGEDLVGWTYAKSQKARNLDRDPRVAISITDREQPYLMARVRGRVVPDAWDRGRGAG